MKLTKRTSLIVALMLITLLSACNGQEQQHSMNQNQEPGWPASFDSVGNQFREISEAYKQDSTRMSPESRMIFHNMETLWSQMSKMRDAGMQNTGKRNGHGMMGKHGMMGDKGMGENGMMGLGMSMMRFHNMNQKMMSYSQGMHQMMRQSGNSGMASMYGQMANHIQQMISKFPPVKGAAPSSSGTSGGALNGALLFVSNCSSCHGGRVWHQRRFPTA